MRIYQIQIANRSGRFAPGTPIHNRPLFIGRYARTCTLAKSPHLSSGYNLRMESGTPTTPEKPRQVAILVLEEDAENAAAVRQLLDSEGWRVHIVTDTRLFF